MDNFGSGDMKIEKNEDGTYNLIMSMNIGNEPSTIKIEVPEQSVKRMMDEAKPAEEQVPHIIDSGKEHEALLEIKAILNKLWLPMKED